MRRVNVRYLMGAVVSLPLLPVAYYQANRVYKSVPKLPEASTPEGVSTYAGSSKTLRVLSLGESTVAGVGVNTHEEGFTGTFASVLAQKLGINVHWKVYAKSRYTAKKVLEEIVPTINDDQTDLIIIGLGGNDTFNLNSPGKWRSDVQQLISTLQKKYPGVPIAFSNMPPIKVFPAFTPLLKFILGNLVEILGNELKDLVNAQPGVYYYSRFITLEDWEERLNVKAELEDYFSDGVHPSKLTYQLLAKDFATHLLEAKEFLAGWRSVKGSK